MSKRQRRTRRFVKQRSIERWEAWMAGVGLGIIAWVLLLAYVT